MKFNKLALAIAVSASLGVTAVHARGVHFAQRHSFNMDVTRTNGAGMTMNHQITQEATANGFHRENTITNPQGKTASRTVDGSYDASSKTYTRTMSGERMNGKTYSSQRVTQWGQGSAAASGSAAEHASGEARLHAHNFTTDVTRTGANGKSMTRHTAQVATANGFHRASTLTNAAGETASKQSNVVIDKQNHTITKDITAVGFNGVVHSGTKVITYSKGTPSQDQNQNQHQYKTQVKTQARVSAQAQVQAGDSQQESAD